MSTPLDQFRLRQLIEGTSPAVEGAAAERPHIETPPVNVGAQNPPYASELFPKAIDYEPIQEAMGDAPSREEYEPSLKRKILASALGGLQGFSRGAEAGIATGRMITDAPYNRAQEDYESRLEGAQQSLAVDQDRFGSQLEAYKAFSGQDPTALADIAGTTRAAELQVEAPYAAAEASEEARIAAESSEQEFTQSIELEEIKASNITEAARIKRENDNEQAGLDRASREKISAAGITSREKIAEWGLYEHISPQDQIESDIIAQDRVLRNPEHRFTSRQLKRIAEQTEEGYWILKEQSAVPDDALENWAYYRGLSDQGFREILDTFSASPLEQEEVDEYEEIQ